MRPFRSFLLLLLFLICFAGLSYFLPWDLNLPKAESLIPAELINILIREEAHGNKPILQASPDTLLSVTGNTVHKPLSDTLSSSSNPGIGIPGQEVIPGTDKPDDPLRGFIDSLKYSKGQVRIMYYGDSQIEGDRLTSFLRSSLREGHGGTGPGLFLPVMPVTY